MKGVLKEAFVGILFLLLLAVGLSLVNADGGIGYTIPKGNSNGGIVMWGSTDAAFDTGDEVCATAELTCKDTLAAAGLGTSNCSTVHATRFVAFCY